MARMISAVESAPPENAQSTLEPAGGKVQRERRSLISELGVALAATERMLESGHRLEVARNQSEDGAGSDEGEDDADPPVPDVGCEHESSLAGGLPGNCAVAVEVFAQTHFESLEKARW